LSKFRIFHSKEVEDVEHVYHTTLEHKVKGLVTPFQEFMSRQVTASIFLLVCTIAALTWSSIPVISSWYTDFVKISIGFHISDFMISEPLHFWVNEVLLTFFFFLIGIEIKREFLVGELANYKIAIFVLFGAIGGMLIPASIYFILNMGTQNQLGWGIPMATDTAFALGVLTFFKNKLPEGVFTFIVALAIIDDIGAILVIAIFYTAHVNILLLFTASLLVALLALFNYAGFRKPFIYIAIGLLVWLAIEGSGIHGAISGILVALIIPSRPEKGPREFIKKAKTLLRYFEKKEKTFPVLEDKEQHSVFEKMQEISKQATTPLQRWESKLELPIALLVLPIFAFVNAGIPVNFHLLDNAFTNRVSLGIILGLVVGKPVGVLLFSRIALWCNLGMMPDKTRFNQLVGASILTGIGFTMSLFMSNLVFFTGHTLLMAKAGILFSSIIAAILGILFILFSKKRR
jgi:NhaA family Na+:H+ antiporter